MNLMKFGGGGGAPMIKSIQRFYVGATTTGTVNIPINSVVPENCIILASTIGTTELTGAISSLYVSSATTVTYTSDDDLYLCQTFYVIEFDASAVKSKQSGTGTYASDKTYAITISSVTPANCIATCYGYVNASGAAIVGVKSISATTLTLYQCGSISTTVRWDILELK